MGGYIAQREAFRRGKPRRLASMYLSSDWRAYFRGLRALERAQRVLELAEAPRRDWPP